MSKGLSERVIDPWELARHQQRIQGEIAVQSLTRLHSQLAQLDGQILLNWQFDLFEHHAVITGQLELSLFLQCQRCLQAMHWIAQVDTALCPLKAEQSEQNLPTGFDSSVLAETPVRLGWLVEDEVLLVLPFAPAHPQCPAHDYQQNETPPADFLVAQKAHEQENPFQVLSALKLKQR